jgi:hypothetical protein
MAESAQKENEKLIEDITRVIGENKQILVNLTVDHEVRFPKLIVKTEIKPGEHIPSFTFEEIFVVESSFQRTASFRVPPKPEFVPLPDLFSLRTQYQPTTVPELVCLNEQLEKELEAYKFFRDSSNTTGPLRVILQNVESIKHHLDNVFAMTLDMPSALERFQQEFEAFQACFGVIKNFPNVVWTSTVGNEPRYLHGLGITITNEQSKLFTNQINTWVTQRTGIVRPWTLKYQATKNGFDSKIFHQLCDNHVRLLVIVRTVAGYVCGGFTSVAFNKANAWIPSTDNQSFVFTLINPHNIAPTMCPLKIANAAYTIYGHENYGPIFGGGHDLYIVNNANTVVGSYSILNHSYEDPTGKGNTLFAGQQQLGLIAEILCFTV